MPPQRRCLSALGALLVVFVCTGLAATVNAQEPPLPRAAAESDGRPTTIDAVADALAKSVNEPIVRQFAFCQLRAAWWGNYDVFVKVGSAATTDRKPRILKIIRGEFTQTPGFGTLLLVEAEGKGDVMFPSKEAAFAKGVPFFISDGTLTSPTELSFAVHSNPAVPVSGARASTEVRANLSDGIQVTGSTLEFLDPLSSKPEPQARTLKFRDLLNPKNEYRFLLVTLFGDERRCLVSNMIDLNALLKALPPQ